MGNCIGDYLFVDVGSMTKLDARFIGPEIPQSERREIVRNDRASTLIRHAENLAYDVGGRYRQKQNVTGVKPLVEYPRIPSGPWSGEEPNPVEPPLGMTTPNNGEISFAPIGVSTPNCDPAPVSDNPSGAGNGEGQERTDPVPHSDEKAPSSLATGGPEGDRVPEISPCGPSLSAVVLNSERPTDSIPLSDGPRPALSGSPSRMDARASLSPGDAEKLGSLLARGLRPIRRL
jgi:hypothetical protein